ncbi:MAG TPA: helix-turn-helix transcriptional regulator [Candidatus Dormibacteraeota bacterium]|nr:helix-turn-helix transcriptional regulator [Candidatus Dormibacteraeota bacterium]
MSAALATERLRFEMSRRGMNQSVLANLCGLTPATICAALGGRPVAESTVARIARALCTVDPIPGIDELLDTGDRRTLQLPTEPT